MTARSYKSCVQINLFRKASFVKQNLLSFDYTIIISYGFARIKTSNWTKR